MDLDEARRILGNPATLTEAEAKAQEIERQCGETARRRGSVAERLAAQQRLEDARNAIAAFRQASPPTNAPPAPSAVQQNPTLAPQSVGAPANPPNARIPWWGWAITIAVLFLYAFLAARAMGRRDHVPHHGRTDPFPSGHESPAADGWRETVEKLPPEPGRPKPAHENNSTGVLSIRIRGWGRATVAERTFEIPTSVPIQLSPGIHQVRFQRGENSNKEGFRVEIHAGYQTVVQLHDHRPWEALVLPLHKEDGP